jgi:acetyl esterase
VSAAQADVLCDEGVVFGRKLRQAGVDVIALRYAGIIHDFVVIDVLVETNAALHAVPESTRALT